MRIGIGYDVHRLVEKRKLMLGGIEVPFDKGLLGYSDGDAVLHALADAMLGALSLGDIGKHFPPGDSKWKNIDSKIILKKVHEMILENGFRIGNIDCNIIAEKPKLNQYFDKMKESIAEILTIKVEDISIKARTNEGLDSVGKGEAIATQAVVLLAKK